MDPEDEIVTPASAILEEESPAIEAPEAPVERTALDVVRERRAELRGTSKPAATPAAPEAPETSGDEGKAEAEPKDDFYSDDELAGMDLRSVDMKRVPPALRATVGKMQTAERKKHEALNRERAALQSERESLRRPVDPPKPAVEEDEDLPFSKDELTAIFQSKAGRAMLREVLKEEGLSLEGAREDQQTKIVNRAISSASTKHPEMKDDAFFDEVVSAIESDADWTATFEANKGNSAVLAGVFKAAAAEVKASRGAAEKKTVDTDKERVKRAKEAANAKPGSQAAKAVKKSGGGSPLTDVDFIKQRRAQLRGT